jgi:hypothetical protein
VNPGNAGRSQDVSCDAFRAGHSEYIDGLLTPVAAARLSAHAVVCESCARYDRIVRTGAELVRELPAIEPSADFELRLQHRIFHVDDARVLEPRATGAAAALGIAAAIALLAWSPLLMERSAPGMAASARVESSAQDSWSAAPLLSQTSWYPVSMPAAPAHESVGLLAAFPGPYSPLVVAPPVHRSVRTVSAEYLSVD